MTKKPDHDAATEIGVSRGELNNWEKAAALYRKRQWRAYRERDYRFDPSLPRIHGERMIGIEIDPCPDCIKAAQLCDLYAAFERTINRCADGR